MKLMVFDVGGTEIKYSTIDDDLNITNQGYVPTPKESFEQFASTIYDIYRQYKDEVEGIAISMLGFVNLKTGVINGGGILKYTWGKSISDELSKICGCKVIVENDGKAAAKAEYLKGSLIGCSNAAVFVIGTGVGGGEKPCKEGREGVDGRGARHHLLRC